MKSCVSFIVQPIFEGLIWKSVLRVSGDRVSDVANRLWVEPWSSDMGGSVVSDMANRLWRELRS